MKLKILALVVMLGIVGRVDAGYYSAAMLLSDCESEYDAKAQSCISYLGSVHDTTDVWVSWGKLRKYFCMPGSVTLTQLRKIYLKYGNENPEMLHATANSQVIYAFMAAFPCE